MLLCVRVLSVLGLWPGRSGWTLSQRVRCVVVGGAIALHLASEFVQMYKSRSDLPGMAALLCVALSGFGGISKLTNVAARAPVMSLLVEELGPTTPQRLESRLTAAALILWIGTNGAWLLAPIVRRGDDLPFIAWFPGAEGAPFGSGPYLASYTFQVVTSMAVVITIAVSDCFFVAMLLGLAGRLGQLRRQLLSGEDPGLCVAAHQAALRCLEHLQAAFGAMLLLQFASSCFIICTVGFLVTLSSVQDADALVKSLLYLSVAVLQLLLVCAFGEALQAAGAAVAAAAYDSGWEQRAQTARTRALALVLLRAQRPLVLRAGGLYPVTLSSFASVLNTSYSYFALLRTMNE